MGMPPRALRPSRSACGCASKNPGSTERPPSSMRRVVGAASLRSAASSPTDTACANRELRSSVMILPPCRIKSGGGMRRHRTAFSRRFAPARPVQGLSLWLAGKHDVVPVAEDENLRRAPNNAFQLDHGAHAQSKLPQQKVLNEVER